MKKILFATTALVATAGVAAADVAVTGFAEIGLYDNGNGDVQFFQDLDVTFSMTGETDGGLTFGASIDIDEVDNDGVSAASTPADDGGATIFISGGFGKLTMGDTDGAQDWALTETGIGGALADDHTSHAGYNGNNAFDGAGDGQILRYEYAFDAFGVAISAEQGDDGVGVADDIVALGLKYDLDLGGTTVALGLGYQDAGTGNEFLGLSAAATFGAFKAILNYSDWEIGGSDADHIGLGLGYTMDALTVSVNYGEYDFGATDADGFGLAVNYDLGGGAVAQFGYADSTNALNVSTDTFSLGLALSF